MNFSIVVFDVGHGDSLLIRMPDNRFGIIDCNRYRNIVPALEYIRKHSIDTIEFLCLTHPHADHFMGMSTLLEHCSTSNIAVKRYFECPTTPRYFDLPIAVDPEHKEPTEFVELTHKIDQLEKTKQIQCIQCSDSTTLYSDGKFTIRAIAPHAVKVKELLRKKFSNPDLAQSDMLNHFSIVLLVESPIGNALLLSDSMIEDQKLIMERHGKLFANKINMFKISHHGSTKSHYNKLIRKAKAKDACFAGISAGCRYNLPSEEVIRKLKKSGIRNYATNAYVKLGMSTGRSMLPVADSPISALMQLTNPTAQTNSEGQLPYHGTIEFRFTSSGVSVTPEYDRPVL